MTSDDPSVFDGDMHGLTVWCDGEVPALTEREVHELLGPLSVDESALLVLQLEHHLESATRSLDNAFAQGNEQLVRSSDAALRAELDAIATDPARALGVDPTNRDAYWARQHLLRRSIERGHDPSTRVGAAWVGDLAKQEIALHKPQRRGSGFRLGAAVLLEHASNCLLELSPETMENLPSHEGSYPTHPATVFARLFLTLVSQRTAARLEELSQEATEHLLAIRDKTDRAIEDGLRRARKFSRDNDAYLEALDQGHEF